MGTLLSGSTLGGNLEFVNFSMLVGITFVNAWQNHSFLTGALGHTLTANAAIQSAAYTASREADNGEHYQEINAAGAGLTWSQIS